ncbi:MAG: low temperature requirement protein A [Marinobacter sp.]
MMGVRRLSCGDAHATAKAVHTLGHAHSGQIEFDTYLKYVLVMIPLWWAWTGHILFANRFDTDGALQRVMTLAQMVAAASLSLFIDFDPNYHGFLLSYVAIRGLGFTAGLLISLSKAITCRSATRF